MVKAQDAPVRWIKQDVLFNLNQLNFAGNFAIQTLYKEQS